MNQTYLTENTQSITLKFILFAISLILVSYWIGFFSLNFIIVFLISAVLFFAVLKKFNFPKERIPVKVLISALIVLILCASPLLFLHPFYQGSADPFHAITLRTLQFHESIPQTYEPYSDVSFTYQIGFELMAKPFADALFFLEDFQVLWVLGLVFAAMEVILFYLAVKEITGSEKAGVWSAILVIGTKTLFINFYYGMFMRIFAACLILAFFYLYKKKNKLYYFTVPALIAVHPGYFINFILLLVVYIIFNPSEFKPLLKLIPAGLLAIPAFIQNYYAYIANMLFAELSDGISRVESIELFGYSLAYVLSLGWAPAVLFGIALVFTAIKRTFSKEKKFALAIFVLASAVFFFSGLFNVTRDNVYPWLYSFGAILFISIWLSELKPGKALLKKLEVLVVIGLILGFFGSSYLVTRAIGSKISPEEANFAFEFKSFDPELKTVVFLGMHSAKPAEYSNKIPFNASENWFLPFDSKIMFNDEAFFNELEKAEKQKEIEESKCLACLFEIEADYVAIDSKNFPVFKDRVPVMESGSIKLYKLN